MLFTVRHIKLYVIGTQTFGQRSLSPLYPEVDVTRVTGRNLQRMLSEFSGPNSMWVDITCVCTASSLTVRFDPSWTVVVDAVSLSVFYGLTASTELPLLGIMLAHPPSGRFFSRPDRSRNRSSRSEQSRSCFVGLKFAF